MNEVMAMGRQVFIRTYSWNVYTRVVCVMCVVGHYGCMSRSIPHDILAYLEGM